MVGERDEIPRGISLEQAQLIGLQWSHDEIREEMTGIRDQMRFGKKWRDALMQMMQRNNLQPQQRQARKVQWNAIVETELEPNRDDEADERGRLRR
jgi:hypothetical protein